MVPPLMAGSELVVTQQPNRSVVGQEPLMSPLVHVIPADVFE